MGVAWGSLNGGHGNPYVGGKKKKIIFELTGPHVESQWKTSEVRCLGKWRSFLKLEKGLTGEEGNLSQSKRSLLSELNQNKVFPSENRGHYGLNLM